MLKGLKGLIAGVLAGTAVGVLFAPKKGNEIRKKLKKEIKDGGLGIDAIKETFSEMGKEISDSAIECYEEVSKNPEVKKAGKAIKKQVGELRKSVEAHTKSAVSASMKKAKPKAKAKAKK